MNNTSDSIKESIKPLCLLIYISYDHSDKCFLLPGRTDFKSYKIDLSTYFRISHCLLNYLLSFLINPVNVVNPSI